jgi:hypothetical protein
MPSFARKRWHNSAIGFAAISNAPNKQTKKDFNARDILIRLLKKTLFRTLQSST